MHDDIPIAGDSGLWVGEPRPGAHAGSPALFLDRDGVLVEEVHFLKRPADVKLTSDAAEAIAGLNERAIPVVLVSNQSGIARGILSWDDFAAVQSEIARQLEESNAHLDLVLACGYHKDGAPPLNDVDHPWRKPNIGMLDHARSVLDIDVSRSMIVGDRASDISAGSNAGLSFGNLVRTGYGNGEGSGLTDELKKQWSSGGMKFHRSATMAGAIDWWLDQLA